VAIAAWTADGSVGKMFQVMRPYMPPPPTPAPPSPFEWGRRERLRELLSEAFALKFEAGTTTYYDRDGQSAWRAFLTGYGPTKMLAASLDETRRRALERDFIAFHDGYSTELGIAVPREYLLTLGERRATAD